MAVYATGCDLNRSSTLAPLQQLLYVHRQPVTSQVEAALYLQMMRRTMNAKSRYRTEKGDTGPRGWNGPRTTFFRGGDSKIRIPSVCLLPHCRAVFLWVSGDVKSALAPLTNTISTSHYYQQHVQLLSDRSDMITAASWTTTQLL